MERRDLGKLSLSQHLSVNLPPIATVKIRAWGRGMMFWLCSVAGMGKFFFTYLAKFLSRQT